MNLPHILHAVDCEPWCILPSAHAAVRRIVQERFLAANPTPPDRGQDWCGNALESMQVSGGLAIIPVGGVMARKIPTMRRGSGAVDTEDVNRDLDWAEVSNDVQAVLLEFDSPGGTVNGTPELADRIARMSASKPTYAFTAGLCCSAAYWAACQTSGVFATRSATLGSVGVYMPWVDSTAFFGAQGFKVELFASGPFKGTGYPGTALTNEQRAMLQSQVESLASEFQSTVMQSRTKVDMESLQGQTFSGSEAVLNGLCDQLVTSRAQLISLLGFDSALFAKAKTA
jgi:signal peptide peptidase SppA